MLPSGNRWRQHSARQLMQGIAIDSTLMIDGQKSRALLSTDIVKNRAPRSGSIRMSGLRRSSLYLLRRGDVVVQMEH